MDKKIAKILIIALLLILTFITSACTESNDDKSTVYTPVCTESNDADKSTDNGLHIYFIDVGKGDASLIGLPDGKWIMIDVGDENDYPKVIRVLKYNNIKELDAIFISHPHKDHASALYKILEHAECKVIYTSPFEFKDHSPMLREMAGDVPIKTLKAGEQLNICGLKIDILGPNGVFAEENDNSMVMMLDWNGKKALFAGDQQKNAEKILLEQGWPLKCDILKAGHHGQDTASSDEFLKGADPQYCIVTNKFKDEEYNDAVGRLGKFGSKVLVLGTTGTLIFEIKEGVIHYDDIDAPLDDISDVKITGIDIAGKKVTIYNGDNKDVSLYGWSIDIGKNENTYFFDDNMIIKKGEQIVITSELFAKFKKNKAILYDQYGREVSRFKS